MAQVRPIHGQRVGLCVSGQRRWFARHGLDFRAFVKDGLPEEAFEGIEDDNLRRVLEAARADEEKVDG